MSENFSFSVHENDYSQVFELNSTNEILWPEYKSIENFIGRKCFEFEWISGDKGFGVGVYSVYSKSKAFFFGGLDTKERFISRDPDSNQENDEVKDLSITFTQNTRYMVCFDMMLNKLILVTNENQSFYYDHVYEQNSKWKVLFHQANHTMNDTVKGYFHHNDFKNPMPVAFYSLIDRRCYDYKSIKNNEFKISSSLILVNILYNS